MSRPSAPPPFRFSYGEWLSLPAQPLGERAVIRQLPGGDSLTWRLELGVGAQLTSRGLPSECVLSVWSGRLTCTVLGNRIELATGHFALIPPNVPIAMRAVGQEETVVVGSLCQHLADSTPFEPV